MHGQYLAQSDWLANMFIWGYVNMAEENKPSTHLVMMAHTLQLQFHSKTQQNPQLSCYICYIFATILVIFHQKSSFGISECFQHLSTQFI